jgi:hypothetical protein
MPTVFSDVVDTVRAIDEEGRDSGLELGSMFPVAETRVVVILESMGGTSAAAARPGGSATTAVAEVGGSEATSCTDTPNAAPPTIMPTATRVMTTGFCLDVRWRLRPRFTWRPR